MLVCITIYQVNNKHMFTLQAIDKVECLTQSLEPIKFEDMGLLGWFCWGGWGQDVGSNSSFDKHPQDQCSVVVVGAKTWEVTVHLTKNQDRHTLGVEIDMLIEEFSDVKVASQRIPSNSNIQSVRQSMCNQAKQYSFLQTYCWVFM